MSVFISYASQRQQTAEHMASYLDRRGVETWLASRDIRPGEVWDEAVNAAITRASALVLLFCADADQSRQVKREIHLADRANIPVYPVRLQNIEPQKLGYFLTAAQWIDWMDERDSTLDTLIQAIDAAVGEVIPPAADRFEPPVPPRRAVPAWPKLLASFASESEAAEGVGRLIFEGARRFPENSVVLPTGSTATRVFRSMVRVAEEYGPQPFGESMIITDTETFGVYSRHPTSRTRHVVETLIEPLRRKGLAPDEAQLHLLEGLIGEDDPIRRANLLLRDYPPSVHAVSVSPTGEVLAYDVGSHTDEERITRDGCKIVEVTQSGRSYIDGEQPSRSIITVGLGTCLSSRVLALPVLTINKARILNQLVSFAPTPGVPGTLLRHHLTAVVCTTARIVDEADVVDEARHFDSPSEFIDFVTGEGGFF